MNPEQFIREFGVEKARDLLDQLYKLGCPDDMKITVINGMWQRTSNGFTYPDLKRLLESLDLVNCFDDLEQAKSWVSDMDEDLPYVFKGDTYDNRFYKHELVTAIADHESIYGGGDE
ncbi:TPA: hypothetical protein ACSBV5_003873 [Acinetobacter baumannii]|nr:hypothetical protein [Acinetobacter baumannii]HDX6226658.1 hypothetical protein [Acinetobacter baumannii]HDX6230783.1 hypothetical protein [Acinetobacter baumannii]HEH4221865.1 hypothetical protein [Acinetobacter baumannii]